MGIDIRVIRMPSDSRGRGGWFWTPVREWPLEVEVEAWVWTARDLLRRGPAHTRYVSARAVISILSDLAMRLLRMICVLSVWRSGVARCTDPPGLLQPPSAVAAVAATDAEFDGPRAVATASAPSGSRVAVVAYTGGVGDGGLQLINVTDPAVPSALRYIELPTLEGANAVATFADGDAVFAIIASQYASSLQIIELTDETTPVARGSAQDGSGGFTMLNSPRAVCTFVQGGANYAIVSAQNSYLDWGIQIVDLSDPSRLAAVSSATDGVEYFLGGARGITTFSIGASVFAAVASHDENAVQIIDISDPANLRPVSRCVDGQGGFTELGGAHDVAAFEVDDSTYIIVVAQVDDSLQIIEVSDPAAPVAVSSARGPQHANSPGVFELDGASAVSISTIGDSSFAIVVGQEYGVQVVDITNPASPEEAGHATYDGVFKVRGARSVEVFEFNGMVYSIIAATDDNAIQLLQHSQCTVAPDPEPDLRHSEADQNQNGGPDAEPKSLIVHVLAVVLVVASIVCAKIIYVQVIAKRCSGRESDAYQPDQRPLFGARCIDFDESDSDLVGPISGLFDDETNPSVSIYEALKGKR
eukprot:COSAG02_NODE_3116_length_7335_cov_2.441680_3_plen_587_part_00